MKIKDFLKSTSGKITLIVIAIILVTIIAFLVFRPNPEIENSEYKTKSVNIEVYDDNFKLEKTIEVTKTSQVNDIIESCNNISYEFDDVSKYLAIKNQVKVDLNNGIYFYIQLDQQDYCFINDTNKDIEQVILMPDNLYELVTEIISEQE